MNLNGAMDDLDGLAEGAGEAQQGGQHHPLHQREVGLERCHYYGHRNVDDGAVDDHQETSILSLAWFFLSSSYLPML